MSHFPAVDRSGQYELRKDGADGIRTGVSAEEKRRQLCPEMRRWRLENAGLYIGV